MRAPVLIALILCGRAVFGAETAVAPQPDPKQAVDLSGFTPAPRVVAQAETLDRLVAVAKPTIVWNADMLWVKTDGPGRFSFEFGTAKWIRIGNAPPVWGVLRCGNEHEMERDPQGFVTSEVVEVAVRKLAPEKSHADPGDGDYARIVLHGRGCDLYEIGIENISLGSGHWIEQRRIYVLRGPGEAWKFVGEGPAETSGSSGSTCSWQTTSARARLTGDPQTPVVVEFTTVGGSDLTSADTEPAYPRLEIRHEALLDGSLPAKLRWLSDPYVEIDKGRVTLDVVIKRYTYWVINDGHEGFTDYAQKEATVFRRLVEDRSPALRQGDLPVGAIVHFPSHEEIQEHLQPHGQ
jgi:hypothetical protein